MFRSVTHLPYVVQSGYHADPTVLPKLYLELTQQYLGTVCVSEMISLEKYG